MIENSNNATDHLLMAQRLMGIVRSVQNDPEYAEDYKAVLNADHIATILEELNKYLLENSEHLTFENTKKLQKSVDNLIIGLATICSS